MSVYGDATKCLKYARTYTKDMGTKTASILELAGACKALTDKEYREILETVRKIRKNARLRV